MTTAIRNGETIIREPHQAPLLARIATLEAALARLDTVVRHRLDMDQGSLARELANALVQSRAALTGA